MIEYLPRIVDRELELRLQASGATLIVGPKWCGKTTTGEQKAKSVLKMQDPDKKDGYLATAAVKPSLLLKGENPRLIDEWQIAPVLWDAVRTAIDQRQEDGLFILTGSTSVDDKNIMHTGTGRIARMKMYPMSLYESGESNGQISLRALFQDALLDIDGVSSQLSIEQLIFAACRGGWPATLRRKNPEAQLLTARDYISNICESDISTVDGVQRNPTWTGLILRSCPRRELRCPAGSAGISRSTSRSGRLPVGRCSGSTWWSSPPYRGCTPPISPPPGWSTPSWGSCSAVGSRR